MKFSWSLLFTLLLLACYSSKKTEDKIASDSTTVSDSLESTAQAEDSAAPPVKPDSPGGGTLPAWDNDVISARTDEQGFVKNVDSLLSILQSKNYLTVSMFYDTAYMSEDNESEYNETRHEVNTFYLDSAYHLRAYSHESSSEGMSVPSDEIEIYVIDDDSLVAGYMDHKYGWPKKTTERQWLLRPKCPSCGLEIKKIDSVEITVVPLKMSWLIRVRQKIEKELTLGAAKVRANWGARKKVEDMVKVRTERTSMEKKGYDGEEYTEWYYMTEDVFNNYISKVPAPKATKK